MGARERAPSTAITARDTTLRFFPLTASTICLSAFLQDELKLTDSLSLTIGSKVEHNGFTGLEFEPSAQLVWTPTKSKPFGFPRRELSASPVPLDAGILNDVAAFPAGPRLDCPGGRQSRTSKPEATCAILKPVTVFSRANVSPWT